jgi:putative ABC transport system permease protein
MQIEMAEGRNFSESFSANSSKGFLVNEEVLKVMGTKSGVGKNFTYLGIDGQIIGVMKNFQYGSAKRVIDPLVFCFAPHYSEYVVVRFKGGNIPAVLEGIKSVCKKFAPAYPFEYKFIDEDFAAMYKTDEQKSDIFKYGAFFAIIIACLGLFGFASFTIEKRTKEIGIRKTLGASTSGITVLLTKEFVKWVFIANVIAWPVAYLFLNNWLLDYAYRISIQWWVFAISGIVTVSIALLTVGYQAIRSATVNPVESLRSE